MRSLILCLALLGASGCVSHAPMSVLSSGPLAGSAQSKPKAGIVASGQALSGIEPLIVMRSPCSRTPDDAPPGACDEQAYRGVYQSAFGIGGYAVSSERSNTALSVTLGLGVAGIDVTWWPVERVAVTAALSAPSMWAGYLTYVPIANQTAALVAGAYVRRRTDTFGFDYPSESYTPQWESRASHDAGIRLVLRLRDPSGGPIGLVLDGRAGYDWALGGFVLGVSAALGG